MFILGGNSNTSYEPGTNSWLSNTSQSSVLNNNRLNNVLTDLTNKERENKYYLLSMVHTDNAYASTISIKLLDTSSNYVGLVSTFNINAYDTNNIQLTDFSNYPISIQATLPNANVGNTLNIYKLYGNSLMNPQPANYPRQLTYQGNYIWTATLPSLSNFVILDDTYIDPPTMITIKNITTNSANVYFTKSLKPVISYNLLLSGALTISGIINSPYSLNNLTTNTNYGVSMAATNGTNTSEYSPGVLFKTL
jgi:hypothetical protein